MLDYIVLAEFDINKGNIVKYEYPESLKMKEMILSSYLLPDGAHNNASDDFCFIIKNFSSNISKTDNDISSTIEERITITTNKFINLKELENESFKIDNIGLYDSNSNQWGNYIVNEKTISKALLSIKKNVDNDLYVFELLFGGVNNEKKHTITYIHKDIQFKKLKDNFGTLYTIDHKAIGINFENVQDLEKIEKIISKNMSNIIDIKQVNIDEKTFNNFESILDDNTDLYCYCHLETVKDKKLTRGASMKSIAFCTKKMYNITFYKSLAKAALDEIFVISLSESDEGKKDKMILNIIESIYKICNNFEAKNFICSSINKVLLSRMNFKEKVYINLPNPKEYNFNDSYSQKTLKAEFPLLTSLNNKALGLDLYQYQYTEQIYKGDLLKLISIFKENVMKIFDAIILDKRIMFTGGNNTKSEDLCEMVFSCIPLIGGKNGILKKIYSIRTLYDLDFLVDKSAIYFVTNPIFKGKKDYWDLMCDIESGEVSMSDEYKKEYNSTNKDSDNQFIKELIYRIKFEDLLEYDVQLYFLYYTTYLIDIFSDTTIIIDDEYCITDINKLWNKKSKLKMGLIFKKNNQLENIYQLLINRNVSFYQVDKHIKEIFYRKFIDKSELLTIYSNILEFIKENEFAISLLICNLLKYIDPNKFFLSIYSKVPEVSSYTYQIIEIIKKSKYRVFLNLFLNNSYEI